MDTTQTVSPVAAALALAEVLGFGLPVPRSVTVTPWLLDSTTTLPAIGLQFRAPDPFVAVYFSSSSPESFSARQPPSKEMADV